MIPTKLREKVNKLFKESTLCSCHKDKNAKKCRSCLAAKSIDILLTDHIEELKTEENRIHYDAKRAKEKLSDLRGSDLNARQIQIITEAHVSINRLIGVSLEERMKQLNNVLHPDEKVGITKIKNPGVPDE